MVAVAGVGYDAARLMMVALTRVCARDPKAGRRARRQAVRELQSMVAMPVVRAEAIRGMERECGACRACKGI